jgi:hypothetical protein
VHSTNGQCCLELAESPSTAAYWLKAQAGWNETGVPSATGNCIVAARSWINCINASAGPRVLEHLAPWKYVQIRLVEIMKAGGVGTING